MTNSRLRNTIFVFLFILGGLQSAFATHIIGGEINYKCLGNNEYQISLTVYRDCYLGEAQLDDTAYVAIFNMDNELVQTLPMLLGKVDSIQQIDNCLLIPPNICVETTTYVDTITLLPQPGGYHIAYQRCCRNETILNIIDPLNTGTTYDIILSEAAMQSCNASPILNDWPPTFVCVNRPLVYSSAAFDEDGDSLAYRLCTPLDGGISLINPRPRPSFPPPFDTLRWNSPTYSLDNLLGGIPLKIDPITGLMTGTPNIIGQFVVGVCVDEYRNGVLLSSTRRDFQYNVIPCEDVIATFELPTSQCANQTVQIENTTEGEPDGYLWNFFDENKKLIGTSTEPSPLFAFPDTGNFTVRLIVNPNSICADSTDKPIFLQPNTITADFQYDILSCADSLELQFTDKSVNTLGEIDSWLWTFNGEVDQLISTEQNPKITLLNSQNLKVTLQASSANGCTGESNRELVAMIIPDSFSVSTFDTLIVCRGDSIELNPIFNPALTYSWSPSTGLNDDTAPNPKAFPDTSIAYVVIIRDSANNCELRKNVFLEVIDFDNSFDFAVNFLECGDSARIHLVPDPNYDLSEVKLEWKILNNSQTFFFDNPDPIFDITNTEVFLISGTITDKFGCSKTVEKNLQIDFVKEAIESEFSFCLGDSIALNPVFNPAYTYQWSPAELFPNPTLPNPIIVPNNSSIVTVLINNQAGNCPIERRVNLSLLPTIQSADFQFKISGCSDSITLEITDIITQPEGIVNEISWNLNGDLEDASSTEINPTFVLKNSQFVQLQMNINPSGSCPKTITKTFRANILESINLPDNLDICRGESIALNPTASHPDYIYNWTPNAVLDDATKGNPIATPAQTTTFLVNYTDSTQLCSIQKEVVIKVRDTLPNINAEISVNCDGRTIQITPAANALIFYDFGDNTSTQNSTTPITHQYAESGSYALMLQYADENVCPDSTVIPIDLPEENLSPNFEWNVEACTDNVASLELLDLSKSIFGEITNWEWQLSNGETATESEPVFQIEENQALTAQLIITLDNDAQCRDSLSVVIPPLLIEEDFLDSIIVCAGATIELNPEFNTAYNYLWSPKEAITDAATPNPSLSIEQAQTFVVQVTNEFDCVITENIYTDAAPFIDIKTLEIPVVCEPSEVVLMAESDQTDKLVWLNENGDTVGFEPEILVAIDKAQNFTAIFTDAYNCKNEAAVFVDFQPVSLAYEQEQPVCLGENKVLIINNLLPENALKFDWMPTFEIIEGGETIRPTVSLEEPTTFTFEAGNEAGCKATGEIFVDILPLPIITANAEPETIFEGESSQLSATNEAGYVYTWTPENSLDNSGISNPSASPISTSNYTVTVMDENGCTNTTNVTVNVREGICDFPYIYVPTGFTPNNDGENDVLFVRGVFIDELTFVIYDRWGDKVFETDNQEIGWDGTKNGKALPSGVFGYYLRAVCKNGEEYKRQGNVTLVR